MFRYTFLIISFVFHSLFANVPEVTKNTSIDQSLAEKMIQSLYLDVTCLEKDVVEFQEVLLGQSVKITLIHKSSRVIRKNVQRHLAAILTKRSIKQAISEKMVSIDLENSNLYNLSISDYSTRNKIQFELNHTYIDYGTVPNLESAPFGISIIIPTYNRITECLACVCHFKTRIRAPKNQWELIVVADGCTDGTGNYLDTLFKLKGWENFRVIWTDKEPGKYRNGGWSRNAGAKAARYSHLSFCDTDAYHLSDPVSPSLALLTTDPDTIVVGQVKIIDSNELGMDLINLPYVDDIELGWFTISKKLFIEIGGNSELLQKWGYEDTDLILRLRKLNCKKIRLGNIICTQGNEYDNDHKADRDELALKHKALLDNMPTVHRNQDKPDWGKYFTQPVYPEQEPDFSKVN